MKKNEIYELIESYLDGSLSIEQQQKVEQRMAADSAFREEVELHRSLQEDYKDPARWRLREVLTEVMQEPLVEQPQPVSTRRNFWWWIIVPALLLLVGGIWYFTKPGLTPTTLPPSENNSTSPENDQPALPADKSADDNTATQPIQQPQNSASIAQADPTNFKESPAMEAFMDIRGGADISLQITSPKNGTVFQTGSTGQTRLHFSGSLTELSPNDITVLDLLLFDNKNADKPLLTLTLKSTADANGNAGFDLRRMVNFSRGLYYFRIEERESGDMLWIGKFTIGSLHLNH